MSCPDEVTAVFNFKRKFEEKTGNLWEARKLFSFHPGKYDMVDVNVYQENIFHTKMLIHDFNLDNYLFDMKEAELDRKEGKRIRRLLKQEMYEIFNGRNLPAIKD